MICKKADKDAITDCGIASDVGVTLAQCVRRSLIGAFDIQTDMNLKTQCDPFVMLSRFGIPTSVIHDELRFPCSMKSLLDAESELHKDPEVAAGMSAILQIADDIRLGKMDRTTGVDVAKRLAEDVLLEPGDLDPVTRKTLSYEDSVEGLMSMIMAVLMRKRALQIMGVETCRT